jgi:sn-glycerol 3-phosphate transport system substrate-binding protein
VKKFSQLFIALFVIGWGLLVSAEPLTATFWYSYGGRNREVTEDMIKQFNESQSKYRIKGSFQGDYFQAIAKVRAAIVTKSPPTIFHSIPEVLPNLYESGILENLEPYANGDNPTDLKDFVPGLTQDGYFDYVGKEIPLFAIPFNRSTPILYYNKDMLAQQGVEVPTTWDELREAAAKLTVREGDEVKVWGFEVPIDWWFWLAMVYQAGGSLTNETGTEATFGKAGAEALQFWVDMVNTDKIMKRPPGKDYNAWEVSNTDFINQKAAMIFTSTAFLSYLTDNSSFQVGTAFLPKKQQFATPTGGTFFVMVKEAKPEEKEAGWAFIKWMTEPEQTIYWSKNTGYMPVRISAIESPEMKKFYEENPNYLVAYNQLQYAVRLPFSPVLYEIQREQIQPNLEGPVVGLQSVEDMMQSAVEGSNKALAKGSK